MRFDWNTIHDRIVIEFLNWGHLGEFSEPGRPSCDDTPDALPRSTRKRQHQSRNAGTTTPFWSFPQRSTM